MQGQIQTLATNAQQVRASETQGLSWGPTRLLAGKGCSAHNSLLPCYLSASLLHTLRIYCAPQGTGGVFGRLFKVSLSPCYGGTKKCKAGKCPGYLEKARCFCVHMSDQKKHFDRLPHCQAEFPSLKLNSCVLWHLLYPLESSLRFFFLNILFIFRQRGSEGEREGEKRQCMVAPRVPPAGDLAHNTGICPDWESNQRLFGLQAGAQSTEPHQSGQLT